MRLGKRRSAESGGFWSETKLWMNSSGGPRQFLFALMIGVLLTVALLVWYVFSGHRVVDPLLLGLREQADDTAGVVLNANDLPSIHVDIPFEDYITLSEQRDAALESGILLLDDEDWVGAEIRYGEDTLPVRLRLKGDWVDHLRENKWSFRVKTRNDQAFMGMRSFSLQSPETRSFLWEWLYLEDLRRNGLLAPRYSFLNVHVNGDDWGIYALEESFSKELLESQGRRVGVIVRYDEGPLWRARADFSGASAVGPLIDSLSGLGFAMVDDFETSENVADPALGAQRASALGLLRGYQEGEMAISQVFDADLMGRYLAVSNLWGAYHGVFWHNERYYYNPLTGLLEPIGYDAEAFWFQPFEFSVFALGQYDDARIMQAYVREVLRIADPDYIVEFEEAFRERFEQYQAALAHEFPVHLFEISWDRLEERQQKMLSVLHPARTVLAYESDRRLPQAIQEVEVGNLMRHAVVLHEIRIAGRAAQIEESWVSESDQSRLLHNVGSTVVLASAPEWSRLPLYVTLEIPLEVIRALVPDGSSYYSNTLELVTSLYGTTESVVVGVVRDYPLTLTEPVLPEAPSVEEALARYPFLGVPAEPGYLELAPGHWDVDGDLVLPEGIGLVGSSATTLAFQRGAVMLCSGPLRLSGPEDREIRLVPQDESWAGLMVVGAGSDAVSILHRVTVSGTAGIGRDGWMTTGGVTFYESPLILSDSQLLGSLAEDAINVVRSEFEFVDTEFAHANSDAFDGDFVSGRVEHCSFHDIAGDGIDVSGSNITIHDVRLVRVHDKGVSAGEGSAVDLSAAYMVDVGIGVASKDLSYVTIENSYVQRAWVAAVAAYMKKPEYGPAAISASHLEIADRSVPALVQHGSEVKIGGHAMHSTALDVDQLYLQLEALASVTHADYQLGARIRLAGYQLAPAEIAPGSVLRVDLHWQVEGIPEHDYTVFLHLLDEDGNMVAQTDRMPEPPTTAWMPGPPGGESYDIELPSDLPSGEYRVVVGLYSWQTGERLPVIDREGEVVPNAAIHLGSVNIMGAGG